MEKPQEVIWKCKVTSFSPIYADSIRDRKNEPLYLSKEEIEEAILSIRDDLEKNWKKDFYSRTRDEYSSSDVVKWQMDKAEEIGNKFSDNLEISFNGDVVNVKTEFEVAVLEDWDMNDVIQWVEGFNRITQAYNHVKMQKIVNDYKNGIEIKDSTAILEILNNINRNQTFDVRRKV
jgi:hypothetical protein